MFQVSSARAVLTAVASSWSGTTSRARGGDLPPPLIHIRFNRRREVRTEGPWATFSRLRGPMYGHTGVARLRVGGRRHDLSRHRVHVVAWRHLQDHVRMPMNTSVFHLRLALCPVRAAVAGGEGPDARMSERQHPVTPMIKPDRRSRVPGPIDPALGAGIRPGGEHAFRICSATWKSSTGLLWTGAPRPPRVATAATADAFGHSVGRGCSCAGSLRTAQPSSRVLIRSIAAAAAAGFRLPSPQLVETSAGWPTAVSIRSRIRS